MRYGRKPALLMISNTRGLSSVYERRPLADPFNWASSPLPSTTLQSGTGDAIFRIFSPKFKAQNDGRKAWGQVVRSIGANYFVPNFYLQDGLPVHNSVLFD